MRSPLLYFKNMILMLSAKLRYGTRFLSGPIQTFDKLHLEIYSSGHISLGNYNQNRGDLYLVASGGSIRIGNHCFFNTGCCITAIDSVIIGDYCKFGNNLVIVDHDHNTDFSFDKGSSQNNCQEFISSPVSIGSGTWVGAGVTILRGTRIGKNCVIGAGSVIKGDIPDNTKVIQKRHFHNVKSV